MLIANPIYDTVFKHLREDANAVLAREQEEKQCILAEKEALFAELNTLKNLTNT
jgi:hypothetical protein